MTEISEIPSTRDEKEVVKLFVNVLEKIIDRAQENYSDKLYVKRRILWGHEYDPFIYREIKKIRKMEIYLFTLHLETKVLDHLVDIETNIFEKTGKIICTISDAFIFPIVKEGLTKFIESHEEIKIKEIEFVKNFSSTT